MSFFLLAVEPPALINTVAEPETEERQVSENSPASVVPLPVTPAPLEAKKPSEESVSIPLTVTPPPETVEVKPLVPDEGIPLEVQNRPDIVQGLLADYQVIQRCRGSCIILYYVGGQLN